MGARVRRVVLGEGYPYFSGGWREFVSLLRDPYTGHEQELLPLSGAGVLKNGERIRLVAEVLPDPPKPKRGKR